MEDQQNSIDEVFRQSLGDYREAPPAAAWQKVARRLDNDEGRRRPFLRWPWLMLSLLTIIGGTWSVVALYGHRSSTDNQSKTSIAGIYKQSPVQDIPSQKTFPGSGDTINKIAGAKSASGIVNDEVIGEVPSAANVAAPEMNSSVHKQTTARNVQRRHHLHRQLPGAQPSGKYSAVTSSHNNISRMADAGSADTKMPPADSQLTAATAKAVRIPPSYAPATARKKEENDIVQSSPKVAAPTSGKAPADSQATAAVYTKAPAGSNRKSVKPKDIASGAQIIGKKPDTAAATGTAQASGLKEVTAKRLALATAKATLKGPAAEIAHPADPVKEATALNTPKASRPAKAQHVPQATAEKPAQPKQVPPAIAAKPDHSNTNKRSLIAKKQSTEDSLHSINNAQQIPSAAIARTGSVKKEAQPAATGKKPDQPAAQQVMPAPDKKLLTAAAKSSKPVTPVPIDKHALIPAAPVAETIAIASKDSAPATDPATFARKTTPPAKPLIITLGKDLRPAMPVRNPATVQVMDKTAMATLQSLPDATSTDLRKAEESKITDNTAAGKGTDTAVSTVKRKRYPSSVSLAALGGYESGLKTPAPGRVTGAARLLWHFTPALAIGLQPAFRYGSAASTAISSEKAYQQSSIEVNSFNTIATSPSVLGGIDTLYNYVIRGTFDSIVVRGSNAGGNFWEAELPLILSYRHSSGWYAYGGPSVNFGGKLAIIEAGASQTYTIIRRDTLVQSVPIPASEFVNYFGTSSLEPYSAYKPLDAAPQNPATMRFGYLVGLGYERRRIVLDASLHQQLSGFSNVPESIQKTYSSPYVRLSLGYLLVPQKNTRRITAE